MQGQRHDGEGNSAASFGSRTADERPERHRDGHRVTGREVREEVVLDGKTPPQEAVEGKGDGNSDNLAMFDQNLLLP